MVESAGCVKFPLLGGGGCICLFTVEACGAKMITVASARAASSDGSERIALFFPSEFSEFGAAEEEEPLELLRTASRLRRVKTNSFSIFPCDLRAAPPQPSHFL